MKLVTYVQNGGSARAGLLVLKDGASGAVIDLARALAWVDGKTSSTLQQGSDALTMGSSVLAFVQHATKARPMADAALAAFDRGELPAKTDAGPMTLSAGDVAFLAPIPRPPSMRDGYAFRQHVQTARKNRGLEMIPEFDRFPVFYFTNHQAVIGPGPVHVRPRHLERLDFELEAAIVVGREGRDLSVAEADEAIFGMTIMNDFSARVLQMEEMQLSLGPAKGKDFATALGPYLVTMDELASKTVQSTQGNKFDLGMRAFLNGERLSLGNVADMTWTFAQILERASYGVTLYPGDVVGSGTCGTGCLLELNGSKITHDRWLVPGDEISLEIDLLGRLSNTVVAS
jgi:fumarylacetoacetate (FAA) hydrolase